MTAYSDYPPEPHIANFMHNTEMYRYLKAYAEKFDLFKYIKFNHRVVNVKRSQDYKTTGQWQVTFENETGKKLTDVFDGVLMCSGHHAIPYYPKQWTNQDQFLGKIIHSHSYRDHRGYEDKVVIVVGIGNSGGDLAVELSRIAKQVYHLSIITSNSCIYFISLFAKIRSIFRRYLNDIRKLLPEWISCNYLEGKLNKRFDHTRYGLKPEHRVTGAHPTVNDELPNRIACGMVKVKPNIREFTKHGVVFEDDTTVDHVDDVILATGFSFHFPIIEDGNLIPVEENMVDLYQYMFPFETSDHNTLAVIGLIQPVGSISPISEMQARLFYENLSGNCKIPEKKEMQKSIEEKKQVMSKRYVKSRRHTIQVDYINYMDELAALVGCLPNMKDLFMSDPILALKVYFGPSVPYIYRVQGPHPWSGARQAIVGVDERVFKHLRLLHTILCLEMSHWFCCEGPLEHKGKCRFSSRLCPSVLPTKIGQSGKKHGESPDIYKSLLLPNVH
uniref:Flavin-containing monooxygenase n=1 Tax=Heterorhabditis bacteriophora TaxID=37862 RepID=A0A1I7XJR1_HETBA